MAVLPIFLPLPLKSQNLASSNFPQFLTAPLFLRLVDVIYRRPRTCIRMKIDIVKLQMLQKIAEHQQHPTKASPPTRARPLRLRKRGCRCSRSSSRPQPWRRWSARRCRRRWCRCRWSRLPWDWHSAVFIIWLPLLTKLSCIYSLNNLLSSLD